jgi:hypothetical protein
LQIRSVTILKSQPLAKLHQLTGGIRIGVGGRWTTLALVQGHLADDPHRPADADLQWITRACDGRIAGDRGIAARGRDAFDFFILSDTTDPEIWIAEEAAFLTLRERTGGYSRIFYRHRKQNVARKAGNIADWVRRWGGDYPKFFILDADSVMTADTLLRLVVAMERHPDSV